MKLRLEDRRTNGKHLSVVRDEATLLVLIDWVKSDQGERQELNIFPYVCIILEKEVNVIRIKG